MLGIGLAALLALTVSACAGSKGRVASGSASSPTVAATAGEQSATATTGQGYSSSTAPPAADANAACKLVTKKDLVAAGVTGTISDGHVEESGLQDDPTSSVCSFDISSGDTSTNLLVELSPKGGNDMYTTLQDSFADVTHELDGLGDQAEFTARNADDDGSTDTVASPDQTTAGSGLSQLQVIVRSGQAVVVLQAPTDQFADQASLTALAKTILTALG